MHVAAGRHRRRTRRCFAGAERDVYNVRALGCESRSAGESRSGSGRRVRRRRSVDMGGARPAAWLAGGTLASFDARREIRRTFTLGLATLAARVSADIRQPVVASRYVPTWSLAVRPS